MENQIGSGTAGGLIEFLTQLVEKGRATSGSITPLKTAVRQVLSVIDGDDAWQKTDIRHINISDYIARFKNKTVGKYSADSLIVYQSRLNKAIKWYSTFLENPGWVPPTGKASKKAKILKQEKVETGHLLPEKSNIEDADQPTSTDSSQNDLIAYPFPLRPGKIVRLYLPLDLTTSEAKRLGKYLESLSVDGNITS